MAEPEESFWHWPPGQAPQSEAQEEQVSPVSQFPLPQAEVVWQVLAQHLVQVPTVVNAVGQVWVALQQFVQVWGAEPL